jgi:hypothetical protein
MKMAKPAWNLIKSDAAYERIKKRLRSEGVRYELVRCINNGVHLSKWRYLPTPARERPPCEATCRNGRPCRAAVAVKPNGDWSTRCRRHGGASTGPKTAQGRARQAAAVTAANRQRKGRRYQTKSALERIHAQIDETNKAWADFEAAAKKSRLNIQQAAQQALARGQAE